MTSRNSQETLRILGQGAATLGGLFVMVYMAHFLKHDLFGLYEDDYFYTINYIGKGFTDWLRVAASTILHPIQGRPSENFFRVTLGYLTLGSGGLNLAYLTGCLILAVNSFMLFCVVRTELSTGAAIVAAAVYVLDPADTSRQLIMHQSAIHIGAFYCICSMALFQRRRYVAAWLVAALILAHYESFYLVVLLLPLFFRASQPKLFLRAAIIHVLIWTAILSVVITLRIGLGEPRASTYITTPFEILSKSARSIFIGPQTAIATAFSRLMESALHPSWDSAVPCIIVAAICAVIGARSGNATPTASKAKLAAQAGVALFSISATYLLAFRPDNFPPAVTIGRLTAVHNPGIICTAFLLATLYEIVPARWIWATRGKCVIFLTAAALCTNFSLEVQRSEYVGHWKMQQAFWAQLLRSTGDISRGEYVIVDAHGDAPALPITAGFPRFGNVNYLPLAYMHFVASASSPGGPKAFGIWGNVPTEDTTTGLRVMTPPYMSSAEQPILRDGNFALLKATPNGLNRSDSPIVLGNRTLRPKPTPAEMSPAAPTDLFTELCRETFSEWPTIAQGRNYP